MDGPLLLFCLFIGDIGPYYKSKIWLKSNSSEILPVNYKFIYFHISF